MAGTLLVWNGDEWIGAGPPKIPFQGSAPMLATVTLASTGTDRPREGTADLVANVQLKANGPLVDRYPELGEAGLTDPDILVPWPGSNNFTGTQVIENYEIGNMNIRDGANITVRNCRITHNNAYAIRVYSGGTVLLEDCEIRTNDGGTASACVFAERGGIYTLRRVDMWNFPADGIKAMDDCTVEYCIVRDPNSQAGAHADCIQIQNTVVNMMIRYNRLDGYRVFDDDLANAAIILKPDFGTTSPGPVDIIGNYLNGGNYTLYTNEANGVEIGNISVLNNTFGPNYRYGQWRSTAADVTYSGNVDIFGNEILPGD